MAETEYEKRLRLQAEATSNETEYDKRLKAKSAPTSKSAVTKPTAKTQPTLPPRVEVPTFDTYNPNPQSIAPEPKPVIARSVEFKPTPDLQQQVYDVGDKRVTDAFLVDEINDTEEKKQARAAEARRLAQQTTD